MPTPTTTQSLGILLKAYLRMRLIRPGRCQLFANGYGQYGTTLETRSVFQPA